MVLQFVAGPFISIAVLSFIFLMLNIIQIARNIRFYHLVEIADPDQILRFMNGNNQFASTWIFPKKVDTVKRKGSVSVFHIQPGKDTQVLSAFAADYRRPQYIQRWNARHPDDSHIVDDKPTRFS